MPAAPWWPSFSGTAAGVLLADAKTGCMHPANTQTQNILHLGRSQMIVVSSKSQDTMIAIACEAFFLYRGHKRAPKLPGVHVISVECLDRT